MLRTGTLPVPFVTVWFVAMAVFALVGERLHLSYATLPVVARVAINGTHIAAACFVALELVRLST